MSAPLPFDDRPGSIWIDGALRPWKDAQVHVLTHALHYASSVFEGQRAYGGRIYRLREHTNRLIASARMLGMDLPYSADAIDAACNAVVAANGITDGYLRPVAWRGSEQMGVSAPLTKVHVAVAAWGWPTYYSAEQKAKGIRLTFARWRRRSPETAPSHAKAAGLYMICTLAKQEAEAQGFSDALMFDYRGYVAEATGANIFFVRDGELHTPKPDCFLDGITRRAVMALARRRGIHVVERHILPHELVTFSECFLTGSAAEITPVGEIGGYRYVPGAITMQVMDDFAADTRGGAEIPLAA